MGILVERGATQAQGYATGFMILGALQLGVALIAWLLINPEATTASFAKTSTAVTPGEAAPAQA
jgi:hypothetical protein